MPCSQGGSPQEALVSSGQTAGGRQVGVAKVGLALDRGPWRPHWGFWRPASAAAWPGLAWAPDNPGSSSFSGHGGPGERKVLPRDLEERTELGVKVWVRVRPGLSSRDPSGTGPPTQASGEEEEMCDFCLLQGQSLLSSSLCPLSYEAESERCFLPWRGSAVPFPSGVPYGARPSSQAWALAPARPFLRAPLEPGGGPSGPGRWWAARRGCPGRRADCQDRWWAGQGSGARPICSRPPVGLFSSTWG